MRGGLFPFALATLFGILNGVYIFRPMMIEARASRLREEDADVRNVGEEGKEGEVRVCNKVGAKQE